MRRLAKDPTKLLIYGDGTQSKPYIHLDDMIDAFLSPNRAHAEGAAAAFGCEAATDARFETLARGPIKTKEDPRLIRPIEKW